MGIFAIVVGNCIMDHRYMTVNCTRIAQVSHSEEYTEKKRLPASGPCLAQSINQEEMSDKSSEGPKRFDRVDNLCP